MHKTISTPVRLFSHIRLPNTSSPSGMTTKDVLKNRNFKLIAQLEASCTNHDESTTKFIIANGHMAWTNSSTMLSLYMLSLLLTIIPNMQDPKEEWIPINVGKVLAATLITACILYKKYEWSHKSSHPPYNDTVPIPFKRQPMNASETLFELRLHENLQPKENGPQLGVVYTGTAPLPKHTFIPLGGKVITRTEHEWREMDTSSLEKETSITLFNFTHNAHRYLAKLGEYDENGYRVVSRLWFTNFGISEYEYSDNEENIPLGTENAEMDFSYTSAGFQIGVRTLEILKPETELLIAKSPYYEDPAEKESYKKQIDRVAKKLWNEHR